MASDVWSKNTDNKRRNPLLLLHGSLFLIRTIQKTTSKHTKKYNGQQSFIKLLLCTLTHHWNNSKC